MKSMNYLSFLLARKEAKALGADEAILTNERGYICEGCTSNVFLVSERSLATPDEGSGCLTGITRQVVIDLALKLNIPVSQQYILPEDLFQADEVFITNSILELMPIREINSKPIGSSRGTTKGNSVIDRLRKAYRELVMQEIESCI
jgi:branched-subunit amino acid aminotransferase/4-amino-4-deoxychorismate lyase